LATLGSHDLQALIYLVPFEKASRATNRFQTFVDFACKRVRIILARQLYPNRSCEHRIDIRLGKDQYGQTLGTEYGEGFSGELPVRAVASLAAAITSPIWNDCHWLSQPR
jgi:hypothetical protein